MYRPSLLSWVRWMLELLDIPRRVVLRVVEMRLSSTLQIWSLRFSKSSTPHAVKNRNECYSIEMVFPKACPEVSYAINADRDI